MTQRGDSSRLLYVEPDPIYQAEVSSVCEPEWEVETADSAADGLASLDSSVDCVVAADQLPDGSGLSFFTDLRAENEELPFVLFASTEDVDRLRAAFRAGVTDVIYKQRSPGVTAAHEWGREVAEELDDNDNNDNNNDAPTTSDPDVTDEPDGDESVPTSEISDGIVGLKNRLETVEPTTTNLNGITLDVSRSLMGAAADEVDMKTQWALKSLAEEIDANQCLIYEVDDTELSLLHGWVDDEIADTEIHRRLFGLGSETISGDRFPGFTNHLQQFEAACIDVNSLDLSNPDGGHADGNADAAATPVDWTDISDETMRADGDRGTLLALPVVIEWQLAGTIVITVDEPRDWGEDARQRLQAIGELVGHMERRRRQRQELERQNEQLEQFASVISHDLQNPLNVITGYLDLVMETGNIDQLEPAIDAADRMESLLNDLLTLAREGRAVGETAETELETVVTEAWNSVETHDGSLELVGFDGETVVADDSRLAEAFENLFKNAIVHAGEDVNMRIEVDDDTIYVADDGPGIPEEKRDVVFEYGHTGGNGTGLGLAIVRSVIEGHDWAIEAAESTEGGARFDIDLEP